MTEAEKPVRKLTAKQKEILGFIADYIEKSSYPPSIREVGDAFGIRSTNGVFDHLNALVRKGYIQRDFFRARSITILRKPDGSPFETRLETDVRALLEKLSEYELSDEIKKLIQKIAKQLD